MAEKTLEEFGRMYGKAIPRLIDELVEAVRDGDEQRVQEIGGFAGELHATIGELLVGAAARAATMTRNEALLVFGIGSLN